MVDRYRIALAQLNPVVGDIAGNLARARAARAEAMEADVILFSELARDTADGGPAILMGAPWALHGELFNAVVVLDGGKIQGVTFKYELPNYGVFDEKRVFHRGPTPEPLTVRGVKLGIPICEDIWKQDVTIWLADAGTEIFCVPNGSPFEAGKEDVRLNLAASRTHETGVPLIYLNQIGGQDEVVYDGASFVLNADGKIAVALQSWNEQVTITDWQRDGSGKWACAPGDTFVAQERSSQVYHAMVLALRD